MFFIWESLSSKSLMKILNRIGLLLYPYGTDLLTFIPLWSSFVLTVIEDKIWANRINSLEFFGMILDSFSRSKRWGIVSNALRKSKKATKLLHLYFLLTLSLLMICYTWISLEQPGVKPIWFLLSDFRS